MMLSLGQPRGETLQTLSTRTPQATAVPGVELRLCAVTF